MDSKEEYHDPDYPGVPVQVKVEAHSASQDGNLHKIKNIISREFGNELEIRENEIMLIDERMSSARRLLHCLRYSIINAYYKDQRLQLTGAMIDDEISALSHHQEPRMQAELSTLLKDGQRRIHPSVKKLLGKSSVDLKEILFKSREPRNKFRKDYKAMTQTRNYTISADKTKSLRPDIKEEPKDEEPSTSTLASTGNTYSTANTSTVGTSQPRKVPRHIEPKLEVLTLEEAKRNKMKHRYRIIIGNTSKYVPPASRADRSTHKWLLYVRGPSDMPDISSVVTSVTVHLHHSYAPHHIVYINKPPYHISRRGWGEFSAKIEMHFPLPEKNRPATLTHTIKLDRNYTGLQTLGGETIVDVWLYSTPEMLQYEFKDEEDKHLNLLSNKEDDTENWMDFFKAQPKELDVDEMFNKPTKEIEKTHPNHEEIHPVEDIHLNKEELHQNEEGIHPNKEEFHLNNEENEISYPEIRNNIFEDLENLISTNCINKDVSKNGNYDYEEALDLPEKLLNISPKKRIMKYMDPTTGKIYYLEIDRQVDLSKIQEIVINSKGNVKTAKVSPLKTNGLKNIRRPKTKGGMSLLKPEVQNLLKTDFSKKENQKTSYNYLNNDHCYVGGSTWTKDTKTVLPDSNIVSIEEKSMYSKLCVAVERITSIRGAVNYLLKHIPVINSKIVEFTTIFPFVVENDRKYWKLDFAKRRNIEWSRAKLINTILHNHLKSDENIWRTKQILMYSRLHGYYPTRADSISMETGVDTDVWTTWNDFDKRLSMSDNIRETYPSSKDITTLTKFDLSQFLTENCENTDSKCDDEDIDVVSCDSVVSVKKVDSIVSSVTVLPVENGDERLRFLFLERKCADIGIELKNEEVGHGCSYSAVHAVLLSAVKSFAEELIRTSLAAKLTEDSGQSTPPVWSGSSSRRVEVCLQHVLQSVSQSPRLQMLSRRGLAAETKHTMEHL